MKENTAFEFAKRAAHGIAGQFGKNCEVVIHDLRNEDVGHSIVYIENGHVSGRAIGDGPSHIVLDALGEKSSQIEDRISYLTRTASGKVLKSTTIFIRNDSGDVIGLLGINYDVSMLIAAENFLREFTDPESAGAEPEAISTNVAELLDELIEQSERIIGKPAALMSKEEKIRAIKFLQDSGAFLITKSGPKVCKYFGISTYTLYSYLDEIKSSAAEK